LGEKVPEGGVVSNTAAQLELKGYIALSQEPKGISRLQEASRRSKKKKKEDAMLKIYKEDNVGLWPALLRASFLLLGITILGAGARGIGDVKVEKAQVFFSKAGSSSHTLHYSNIKQDFKVKELEETLEKVRDAVRRRATQETFTRPLHNNETRSGHFMEDPTMYGNEKVAHRVEYRLSALISRVGRLFQLFRPIKEEIEKFGLETRKKSPI
jgi:hypothetical protein